MFVGEADASPPSSQYIEYIYISEKNDGNTEYSIIEDKLFSIMFLTLFLQKMLVFDHLNFRSMSFKYKGET